MEGQGFVLGFKLHLPLSGSKSVFLCMSCQPKRNRITSAMVTAGSLHRPVSYESQKNCILQKNNMCISHMPSLNIEV